MKRWTIQRRGCHVDGICAFAQSKWLSAAGRLGCMHACAPIVWGNEFAPSDSSTPVAAEEGLLAPRIAKATDATAESTGFTQQGSEAQPRIDSGGGDALCVCPAEPLHQRERARSVRIALRCHREDVTQVREEWCTRGLAYDCLYLLTLFFLQLVLLTPPSHPLHSSVPLALPHRHVLTRAFSCRGGKQ